MGGWLGVPKPIHDRRLYEVDSCPSCRPSAPLDRQSLYGGADAARVGIRSAVGVAGR